ncbi:monoacylglycerol lipase ABHD6-like isoform X2 [Rhineura floridana]|uniref:monoacylglycerol lipase ABHD6-like isoform X2 n=1 Tax=Rhineura floridana TaxID=261503 RepID=UPI002AC8070C|nr:monoacylglycerol lipase ABHD6-like isoform X2 [Rhineura floridana]
MLTFVTMYRLPSILMFRIMIWYKRQKRGVAVKHVEHDGYRFCYFSRGEAGPQPSVLMLHGFAFNKDIWLNAIKLFPQDLHVVCLDMPGDGETTRLLGESYTAAVQVARIHQFVECPGLNPKPFHLVGFSMGGMVAGIYAARYPSEISGLSLLCPSGLQYPEDSNVTKCLKELQQSINLHSFLKLGLYHPNIANMQLLRGYLEDVRPHQSFFIQCFLDISSTKSKYSLHDNMNKIRAPTQIIWGKEDKPLMKGWLHKLKRVGL